MKKKNTALVMAAILAMTAVEPAVIRAAEFTDEQVIAEEVPETAEDLSGEASRLFTGPEDEAELFSAQPEETEIFDDVQEEALLNAEGTEAQVAGWYVSRETFESYCNGTDEIETEGEPTEGSTADIFGKLPGTNTGYAVIGFVEGQEGFADLVIPKGLNVAILRWSVPRLNSITARGNLFLREQDVETPGTLKLCEGEGAVTLFACNVLGSIRGLGGNDTVIFKDCNRLAGFEGVENAVFTDEKVQHLELASGKTEFYNIYAQETEGVNLHLHMQGYSEDRLPVFHKNFDLGTIHDGDGQGNFWDYPAEISLDFTEKFDVPEGEDWKRIRPKEGSPVVKFAASGEDTAAMIWKMWVDIFDEAHAGINYDGTLFVWNEWSEMYQVTRMEESEGFSPYDAFMNTGVDYVPESCFNHVVSTGTLDSAVAVANADRGSYYQIILPKGASIEKLTVPNGAEGIKYMGYTDYDEATDTVTCYDSLIKSLSVPSGKILGLLDYQSKTGAMNISGSGEAQLINCTVNQSVQADNLSMTNCRMAQPVNVKGKAVINRTSVKTLVCDTIAMYPGTWLTVGEYLKFNNGTIQDSDIAAKAGAYLNIGEIDNTGTQRGDLAINLEVKDGKMPELYFAKAFNLGQSVYEGEEPRDAFAVIRYYDYGKLKAAGSNCAKDIYSREYDFWNEDESKNVYRNLCEYQDKAASLYTLSKEAFQNAQYMFDHSCVEYADKSLNPVLDRAASSKVPCDYYIPETDKSGPAKAYIAVNGSVGKENLTAAATVSAIKNQYYTGKALKPAVTVKAGSKTLKLNTDYTVSYKNNTKVGTAAVTITGKGNYTGSISKTFKIVYPVPKKGASYTVSGLKYTVTKSSSTSGTVSVKAPSKTTNTSVVIPATVKIKGYTFKVTAVGAGAFKNNKKLKAVTIGKNVTSIGKEAFYGCKVLKSIKVQTLGLKTVGTNALKGIYSKAVIKVPASKVSAYKKLLKGKGQSTAVKITK